MDFSIEIYKIIEGALKHDDEKVINYTKLMIDNLEKKDNFKQANMLKKAINASHKNHANKIVATDLLNVPIDKESRLPIADIFCSSENDNEFVFLNDENIQNIELFLNYYNNRNEIFKQGYNIPNSLLFFGPPGTGKTKLAKYLSKETKLPLVVARLDGLISSYLGSTAKNIRLLFEYAQRVPCILFLDEFDAVAKIRDDQHELGELKRVVNSLLQNIDNLNNGSIIIAATNHEKLLDPAVWRRFGFKLKIDIPDDVTRKKIIEYFLDDKNLYSNYSEHLNTLFNGLSGSDIEEILRKSKIDSIVSQKDLSVDMIANHYFNFATLIGKIKLNKTDNKNYLNFKIKYLRELNPKLFSYSIIGEFVGKSKSYIAANIGDLGGE